MRECSFNQCDGSGLIPFEKNSKIIPNVWLHCDCHPVYGLNPEPEHYHKVTPDDYDFPMSSDFRAWTYQYCGVPDPGYIPDEQVSPPATQEIIHRHSNMGEREFALLQRTVSEVNYLRDKVSELQTRKPRSINTYKGIK